VSEYRAHFISAERFLRVIRTTWTKPRKQDSTPTITKNKKMARILNMTGAMRAKITTNVKRTQN